MKTRRYIVNVAILVGITFLPPLIFAELMSFYGLQMNWAAPIIFIVDWLLGFEIVAARESQKYVWADISKSPLRKIAFFCGLVVIGVLGGLLTLLFAGRK
jgi:hypothetical protein